MAGRFSRPFGKRWHWIVGGIIAALLIITGLSYVISSDLLARSLEKRMNRHLREYSVHIGRAYFHPLRLALDLRDLSLMQSANPDPPVAKIDAMEMGIRWSAILRGHVVGDLLLDRPRLYVNLNNFLQEEKSKVPLKQKGWQDAVQSIYPLKINLLTVSDGELTYVDRAPYKPLHASGINLSATNIRNIEYPNHAYPSPISLNAKIFGKGELRLTGDANFLAKPHFGIKATIDMKDLDAGYFAPIASRRNITLKKGTISAKGDIEYAPNVTAINLKSAAIGGIDVDYVHLAETTAREKKTAKQVKETAKQAVKHTESKVFVRLLTISNSRFAYTNKTSNPNYTLYMEGVEAKVENFSNQFAQGPAKVSMTGKFMGTGDTKITGTFRSEARSPDFNLNVAIRNTQMPPMNDLFRAYGKFDIKSGTFSLFSELTVKNNAVNGYVKPLFENLQVTDERTPKEKGVFHKLYIGIVKGLTELLKNPETKAVATQTPISGRLGGTRTNTWQAIVNLVRNAFVRAILPGFERQASQKK
jgi:hypothetical protein